MKRFFAALVILMVACTFGIAQAASMTPEPMGLTMEEFVDSYNQSIKGLMELDIKQADSIQESSMMERWIPADENAEIWIQFQSRNDELHFVSVVYTSQGTSSFEEFLAVYERAISVVAPDVVVSDRYEAISELVIGGIKREAFAEYGQNAAYLGSEHVLFYNISGEYRQAVIVKGSI